MSGTEENEDNPDYQYWVDEPLCPDCGAETDSRECDVIGCEDGFIDEYDDDPVNYAPGESYEGCRECSGHGVIRWCPQCGADYWDAARRKESEQE